jgi:hypothetical protein
MWANPSSYHPRPFDYDLPADRRAAEQPRGSRSWPLVAVTSAAMVLIIAVVAHTASSYRDLPLSSQSAAFSAPEINRHAATTPVPSTPADATTGSGASQH